MASVHNNCRRYTNEGIKTRIFIGKRQNTPKLCFGDEWRVGLEAAAAASLSKKTSPHTYRDIVVRSVKMKRQSA